MQMVTKLPAKQAQEALIQLEAAWSYYMPQPVLVQDAGKVLVQGPKDQDDHFPTAA